METITKEKQTNEEILHYVIQDFYNCRRLSQHLSFLDKLFVNGRHKKQPSPSDLIFFSGKFLSLLGACYEIHSTSKENMPHFEESIKIPQSFISVEQKTLAFYPNYLRKKEICNPLLVFHSIFKTHTLDFYKKSVQNWVNGGMSNDNNLDIFPTYKSLKRIVEACWLIHERSVSKNSYRSLSATHILPDFSHSCPLLLCDEYLNNPYLQIELFFSFADINEYREDLTQWFKAALNDQLNYKNANDLLFIHNQFTQLIHAGYLIGTSQHIYEPSLNYTIHHSTFGHWLLARMENPYLIQFLSPHYRENPIEYCREHLTLTHVAKIRYGLKEWLEAALSQNSSITDLDHSYVFDQFEDLQKILEATFLLIVQPTF